ncbi:MAG: uracil-DNA glycosylase [Candidatus Pelethousia sp.]|nr:uracil-DNA glycosylase [Candidatus Pelethousia sp.]
MATHYDWQTLYDELADCRRCGLCEARTHVVIGEGNPAASIMMVGEGPGRDEDATGRPFVGRAGQLLDKMLAAIELSREQVYIANVVKCRPPNNRTPAEEEAHACLPYLRAQFALVRPAILVCLGATAARYLYDPAIRITRERGVWKCVKGVRILPTYHPAALLRDPARKREAWEDMKAIREKMAELSLGT